MKLTGFLLTISCLQVSADALSQQVSLSVKKAPVEHVLQEIRKQSGYAFFYDETHLRQAKRVSLELREVPVKAALDRCFAGQPFTYEIIERTIIIKRTLPPHPAPGRAVKTQVMVTGRVTDETEAPLPGTTVSLRGSDASAVTGLEGEYTLPVADTGGVLVFRFLGYKTREIPTAGRTVIDVQLEAEMQSMNEVVVVGFGIQKKINLTGAVDQIDGEVLENRPVANIGQAVQGVIPNLNLTITSEPGGPGTDASFNVRGNTSLNSGGPLFIVDGIPVDNINDINPADVESMTVLKDAAASAIYGARAPYGVILVTTKSGRKEGKPVVSYNTMLGQSSYTTLPEMANSLEFAEAMNIASLNSGQGAPFGPEQLQKLQENIENPGTHPVSIPDPNNPSRYTYASPLDADNVDWFRAYFKPWSFSQKHDLSVSGGGKNTAYYIGTGFYNQNGQLRYGNELFNCYNLTGNIRTEPAAWLRVDLRTRFSRRKTDLPYDYAGQMGNWIHMATTRQPNWPLRNPDGHFSHASNIEFMKNGGRKVAVENDLTLTGSLEAEPLQNWKINLDYSYNTANTKNRWHSAYVYAWGTAGDKYNIGPSVNSIGEGSVTDEYQSLNLYSSYQKTAGKHYFKGLIGEQLELYDIFDVSGIRSDLISDLIPSISTATGVQNVYDNMEEWATVGFFARINYNFDEKYLLELNGRYDGTSRFPEGRRFGFFPSVSAGYNLAKEDYWSGLKDYVNTFKLRVSYGSLGNQQVDNYLYLPTLSVTTNMGYILGDTRPSYLGAPPLVSPDFTWETSRTFDVGLDAAFFGNRLNMTYDWYIRNTLNMLGPASVLPATLGVGVPYQNNADMQTRGFELSLRWADEAGENLRYNVSLVLSDYISEIKQYYNPTKLLSGNFPGKTIDDIWGFRSYGLIRSEEEAASMPDQSYFSGNWTPGDVRYADLNGDGKIDIGKNTLSDHGDLEVIGNSTPRYSYGLNLGLAWKGFDFSMFWQGVAKRDLWLGGNSPWNNQGNIFWGFTPGFGNNVYEATLDFWTPENTDAYWPKPYISGEAAKNHQVQSGYLQSGAYLRLKNLQLGYDLAQLLDVAGIRQARIFISGENILTFSGIHENFDPEVVGGNWGNGKIYPLLKTFSLGANIRF